MARHFAGFDIGGTKTMAVVVDEHDTLISELVVFGRRRFGEGHL